MYGDNNGNFQTQILAMSGGQNQVVGDITGRGNLAILSANHGFYGIVPKIK